MKALCGQVNAAVTEVENLQMLYWCQNHINCDQLKPKLVFNSQTNYLGARKWLHGGVLLKAKSGRVLVGLLFNDLLLLAAPDETVCLPTNVFLYAIFTMLEFTTLD